jgi:hypothetical protein
MDLVSAAQKGEQQKYWEEYGSDAYVDLTKDEIKTPIEPIRGIDPH